MKIAETVVRRVLLIAFLSMGCNAFLLAQGRSTESEMDLFGAASRPTPQMPVMAAASPSRGLALESVIDPESYYVGPSDVFSVNIWVSPPLGFQLTVTPEGTLVVPTVGEINLSDLTLADAKKKIVAAARRKYLAGEVTATLLTPRPILVAVTGNILNSGSYELNASNRADKIVEAANRPRQNQRPDAGVEVAASMSVRNIRIQHRDGTTSRVDLERFQATKDNLWSPYLREGDIVVVPRAEFGRNVFGVYGEVNAPGRHEYVRGDSVRSALQMSFGFTALALPDSAVLVRSDLANASIASQAIDARAILRGAAPDIALLPGDRIIVPGRTELRADLNVTVAGEILHPGVYPITKDHTRLSEVIASAGGFTEFAWVENAELIRHSVPPSEIALERLESLRGGAAVEDSAYYYMETDLRIQKEIVNVNFRRLFVDRDSVQDVIVQDGDVIRVPSVRKTIYVFGQVVSPGNVPYVPGESVEYYLRKAGGVTDRARGGDLKVVKSKTRQWLSPDETSIESGDYVWVPKQLERGFAYYVNVISQAAGIVGVAVSLAVLVTQIKK